jgi:O-antigen/teichoic acid export membrane protein
MNAVAAITESSPYRRFLQGGAIVTVLRCAGIASAVGITAAQGRVLSTEDFGYIVLLGSLAAFASLIAQFGLNRSLVRFVAQSMAVGDPQQAIAFVRSGFAISAVSLGLTAIVWVATLLSVAPSAMNHVGYMALLSMGWVVLLTAHQIIGEVLRGFGKQFLATTLSGINGGPLVNGIYLIVYLSLPHSRSATLLGALESYLLSFAIVTPVAVVCLVAVLGRVRQASRDANISTEARGAHVATATLVRVSLALMLVQALSFCVSQGDVWVAGATLAAEELALYGAARRVVPLLSLPLQLGSVAIVPIIATLHAQNRTCDLQRLVKTAANLCFLPSLIPFALVLLFPGLVLTTFVGPQYAGSASLLTILAIGQMVLSWSGAHGMVMMMTGQENALLVQSVIFGSLQFLLTAAAGSTFGVVGLAVTASAVLLMQSVTSIVVTRRLTGIWSHARW